MGLSCHVMLQDLLQAQDALQRGFVSGAESQNVQPCTTMTSARFGCALLMPACSQTACAD